MVEKEAIVRDIKLKYTGVFDLDRTYRKVLDWFEREGYGDAPKTEKTYLERVSPGGKQIEIVFEGKKKEAGYFRAEIGVKIFGKRVQDAETVVDGNKVKVHRGDLDIQVASTLSWNVNDDGKDVFPEASMMKRVYEKFVLNEKIEDAKIDLYKDTMDFVNEMKQFLNLYEV